MDYISDVDKIKSKSKNNNIKNNNIKNNSSNSIRNFISNTGKFVEDSMGMLDAALDKIMFSFLESKDEEEDEGQNNESETLEYIEQSSFEYVVRGALLKCDCGTHQRLLNLPKCHGVYINNHPIVHDGDIISGLGDDSDKNIINIPSFGICNGALSGEIGEGNITLKKEGKRDSQTGQLTEEESGEVLTGKRCKPKITEKWQQTCDKTKIGDEDNYAVTTQSFLICSYGGIITVQNSGQQNNADN